MNTEMFWVVTEICSEHNLIRRSKMIKQFIKVARMYIIIVLNQIILFNEEILINF